MLQNYDILVCGKLAPSMVTSCTHWNHVGNIHSTLRKRFGPRYKGMLENQNVSKLSTILDILWKHLGKKIRLLSILTACWNTVRQKNLQFVILEPPRKWKKERKIGLPWFLQLVSNIRVLYFPGQVKSKVSCLRSERPRRAK